jgi:hypothetical protein
MAEILEEYNLYREKCNVFANESKYGKIEKTNQKQDECTIHSS